MCGAIPSPTETRERPPYFIPFSHTFLRLHNLITRGDTPQPSGSYALYQGARFRCYTHVFENLGNLTIPSDHAAVRLVIHKPTSREQQCKTYSKLDVQASRFFFCSFVQRLHDDHRFSTDPFGALAEFKAVLEKAKKQTIRDLSRKTPGSIGAKLFVASAALRAYRNRHPGTLVRCCEAWKPIENCFDPIFFSNVLTSRGSAT